MTPDSLQHEFEKDLDTLIAGYRAEIEKLPDIEDRHEARNDLYGSTKTLALKFLSDKLGDE